MAEILYAGPVASDKMPQVVDHCHFSREALFLAEQFPTNLIVSQKERLNLLKFTSIEDSPPCTDYATGRIFQDDRELRWEKQGDKLHIIYLGPAEDSADLQEDITKSPKLDDLTRRSEPSYYYLFGERLRKDDLEQLSKVALPGDFAVLRIPRILRYPVPQNNKRYVRLVVCDYLEKTTGRVALFRFQRLETVE